MKARLCLLLHFVVGIPTILLSVFMIVVLVIGGSFGDPHPCCEPYEAPGAIILIFIVSLTTASIAHLKKHYRESTIVSLIAIAVVNCLLFYFALGMGHWHSA
jgi:hypothetical protein